MSLAEEDDIFKGNEVPLEDEDEDEEDDEDQEEEQAENNEDDGDDGEGDGDGDDDEDDDNDDDGEDGDGDGDGEEYNDNVNDDEDVEMAEADEESKQVSGEAQDSKDQNGHAPLNDDARLQKLYNELQFKAKLADNYEVNPFVAIPYSSPINAIALSSTSKLLFTGGDDGFIRKYDFFGSIDGDVQLTAAQKHSLVDSITSGGSLLGYWGNEIPIKKSTINKDTYDPKLSPVFSLAVEKRCLWLLSGLNTGGINLQSIRHNEGTIVHHFRNHTDTVSVLKLNQQEDQFISGSWDKNINHWDLNTGEVVSTFKDATGQIGSLEYRPAGGVNIEVQVPNEDDDMDSLFGDDDEENDGEKAKKTEEEDGEKIEQDNSVASNSQKDNNIFLSSSIDGSINVWDIRTSKQVLRLKSPTGTPPWCVSACWSVDGNFIYAGRRNSTVEEISLKMPLDSKGGTKVSKTLKFPQVSGAVSVVRPLPNGHHILCGSLDNIRIYDLRLYEESQRKTPFLIVPGHHGGVLSDVQFDPTYRYMISASGNRGWQGSSTETAFIYDIELQ